MDCVFINRNFLIWCHDPAFSLFSAAVFFFSLPGPIYLQSLDFGMPGHITWPLPIPLFYFPSFQLGPPCSAHQHTHLHCICTISHYISHQPKSTFGQIVVVPHGLCLVYYQFLLLDLFAFWGFGLFFFLNDLLDLSITLSCSLDPLTVSASSCFVLLCSLYW